MLHEILLSLSGHPSALFDNHPKSRHVTSTPVSLLSPPEAELLSSLAHLSRLHQRTRDHVAHVGTSHPSSIGRAVATAIASYHLERFQRKVLDVERRILTQDASIVGAYNIVPLAGIANEFSEWTKVMEWLWSISNFMQTAGHARALSESENPSSSTASGAEIIDKLRSEAQTGYPDIEEAALYLGRVAETSWLRQLSTWLLYGRLPSFGASDFFIAQDGVDEDVFFTINNKLLPKFVTRQTASSIQFIGKSLNQIRSLKSSSKTISTPGLRSSELELLPEHVEYLAAVTAPISSARLSEAVANIRLSLSRNFLQHLLPVEKIVEVLAVLHQFFLLGRGEFATALVAEADEKLQARHRAPVQSHSGQEIRGILLKEAEVNSILSKSFAILSALGGDDEHTDDNLDLAIDTLRLTVNSSSNNRPGTPGRAKESATALPLLSPVAFNDLLLSVPITLSMDVRSPLDLFMTKADLEFYATINAYIFASRRAHIHISQLWKHSSIRREHPPPPGYEFSNSAHGKAILSRRRQRNEARAREMRKIWATCAAAIFLLAESEAYFQGEIVEQSYKHFLHWVIGALEPHASRSVFKAPTASSTFTSSPLQASTSNYAQHHDPEVLSCAHRQFLSSVAYSLLLTDVEYTRTMRDFFTHVDELVAFVIRLQSIQQNLDLEEDDGVEDFMKNYKQEEKDVTKELDRARRRLDSDMKSLIARLRVIDADPGGAGLRMAGTIQEGGYEPLRVGGIDRLLMKLDWGEADEEEQDV